MLGFVVMTPGTEVSYPSTWGLRGVQINEMFWWY